MSATRYVAVAAVITATIGLAWTVTAAPPAGAPVDQGTRQEVLELLDRMPLHFVPDLVSPQGATSYVVRGRGSSVWLSERGLTYRMRSAAGIEDDAGVRSWVVALDLVGAAQRPPVGEDPLATRVSYFSGPKERWRTGLPSYGSVVYREPWPGIDLVVSGAAGKLKSTFVVRPGADPGAIRLAYRGASAVRLGPDGGLVAETPIGDIREQAPFAYQEVDGRRVEVAAAFELGEGAESGRQVYRFRLGGYDPARELVVDPVTLIYCGYIGGSGNDSGSAIAVDASGNAYIAGYTDSTEASFPVAVGPDLTYNGSNIDAFVAKVNAAGTDLDWCGYIGGSGNDTGSAIAVDSEGNVYLTGRTNSSEATFPVTVGPDVTYNGDADLGWGDAFVAKVNAAGTRLDYCGYIGGSDDESGSGIAVGATGDAYLTGFTLTSDGSFPVAVGPDLTLQW